MVYAVSNILAQSKRIGVEEIKRPSARKANEMV
jgi:hypothetical protein